MRFLTIAILMLAANSVLAQSVFERLDKFYVGGGFNFVDTNSSDTTGVGTNPSDTTGNELNFTTFEFLGGYKHNGFLGIEARIGFGVADETSSLGGGSTIESNIDYHGSIYWRPETANETAKIYGLFGYSTVSVGVDFAGSDDSESESGLSYGGGVGFTWKENWNLNFEYRWLLDDDDNEFEVLGANVDFRF